MGGRRFRDPKEELSWQLNYFRNCALSVVRNFLHLEWIANNDKNNKSLIKNKRKGIENFIYTKFGDALAKLKKTLSAKENIFSEKTNKSFLIELEPIGKEILALKQIDKIAGNEVRIFESAVKIQNTIFMNYHTILKQSYNFWGTLDEFRNSLDFEEKEEEQEQNSTNNIFDGWYGSSVIDENED